MIMVAIVARREGMAGHPFLGFAEIGRTFLDGFFALMAPAVLLGGMLSGHFTPTEAAAVACLLAGIM
jgi:TRAP-type C4-dicarboxylate transport system permease large subunit